MTELATAYTSTGAKFFAHEEAMRKLRNGQGQPIVTHLMPTDICQHTCAFCSVQTRDGNVLRMTEMEGYLRILVEWGLKAVIISGGGNPILYRCPDTGARFDHLVTMVKGFGLEIGLITNGMPLVTDPLGRRVWRNVSGATLDKLTWVRISMSGLDHVEREVYVPDIDRDLTTLGFSYVFHDLYGCPEEPRHGKVSTPGDLIRFVSVPGQTSVTTTRQRLVSGDERLPWLAERIAEYTERCKPRYVRLLPNCLEPDRIPERCAQLQAVADSIDPRIIFVQYKPPAAPNACFLGYVHPVLNSDGWVYPCDSCVLNEAADHKFANPWRVCRWDEVARLYEEPVRSLVDPKALCPGCVFTASNTLLESVVDGTADITPPAGSVEHVNFV